MAFILKLPHERSPGVVVFTHKELPLLPHALPEMADSWEEARRHWVFGVHWGRFQTAPVPMLPVDFHLAGPGTLTVPADHPVPVIRLCSRNFLPSCFAPSRGEKFWDILTVARPIKEKRLGEFLSVVRALYDAGKEYRILLVCAVPPDTGQIDPKHWDLDLSDRMNRLFTPEERQRITLLMLREGYPFCLPRETMAFLFRSSRVFTMMSHEEGESRVITEALLSGLPVVAYQELKGGGLDYLDDTNACLYSDLQEAQDAFITLLDRMPLTIPAEELARDLRQDHTMAKLENALRAVFEGRGKPFYGSLVDADLSLALPSHLNMLPAEWRHPFTDDLRGPAAMAQFLLHLRNHPSIAD